MTTVRDLARLAKVSIATVSLVLNGKAGVSDGTRQRVLALAEQSGYVAKAPRAQRQHKRRTIRLVKMRDSGLLLERNEEFITRLLDGIIQAANDAGYELVVTNIGVDAARASFADVCTPQDAGVVVLATEMPRSMGCLLKQLTKPYVVLDNELHPHNENAVTMNNEQAAYLAASHLYALGHRRIGFITSLNPAANFMSREHGLTLAAEELGFVYDKRRRLMLPHELDDDATRVSSCVNLDVLDAPDCPTAFFAANDMLALAAIRVFRQVGKRVPQDYSLVGMDNLRSSAISTPQLTTITLPNETMGRTAVERLVARLENPDEPPMKTFIGCDLVVRKSTAHLNAARRQKKKTSIR